MEEVERLADHLIILDKGTIIAEGTIDELKKMIKKSELITVEASGIEDDALNKIRELKNIFNVNYDGSILKVEAGSGKHNVVDIISVLQNGGYSLKRVFSEQPTLNDVFLELTGKQLRDD